MSQSRTGEVLDIGQRIARARSDAEMTQAELAQVIGLDRTAIAKLESGTRRVSATELVAIAEALDRPIDWFVTESPPSVVSRRSDVSAAGHSRTLDLKVDRLARDVAFLVEQGVLADTGTRPSLDLPSDVAGAEALATQARALMRSSGGPLYDLQRAAERIGLLAFVLDLGESGGDGAYVEVGGLGVALLNGKVDPGRRRFNLAHELGHHLFGDAYAPEVTIAAGNDTERLINAFAVHLLLPRREVTECWQASADEDRRLAALAIAIRFRASWSAACSQLKNLGIIDSAERERLMSAPPTPVDFIVLGRRWTPELEAPGVPPEYGRRVLAGYQGGKLSASKTVELLYGTISLEDLPEQRALPLPSLLPDFESLS